MGTLWKTKRILDGGGGGDDGVRGGGDGGRDRRDALGDDGVHDDLWTSSILTPS